MEREFCDVLIIGAGLTGLTLAYLLRNEDLDITVLESNQRIGGRILTHYREGEAPIELGATWLGSKHENLLELIDELNIDTFQQLIGSRAIYEAISTSPHFLAQLPPNPDPTFRISGGSSALIDALISKCKARVLLEEKVSHILEESEKVIVKSSRRTFVSRIVISTIPPNKAIHDITVKPRLPNSVYEIASQTHTWMGEAIKVGLTFAKPFWRKETLSGTIMSNVGPVSEMYDHSNVEDDKFALMGFFSGAFANIKKEERLQLLLLQFRKYYGDEVDQYSSYTEKVWSRDKHTFEPYESTIMPHQNNGHSIFRSSYLTGKLIIGGTETSSHFPGYMEGAVVSAKELAIRILDKFSESRNP